MKQLFLVAALLGLAACTARPNGFERKVKMDENINITKAQDTATFGSGCFWCTEAVFQQLKGVVSVQSGYAGGTYPNPTYDDVCSGETGHAEVIQIIYNPKIISYADLLEAFWGSHDPTTLNQQGADRGTQYRSVIFYHDAQQQRIAQTYKQKLEETKVFDKPIVTEIAPFTTFYKAENYHQDYYNKNNRAPYCMFVITPKLEKFKEVFKDKLK